MGDGLCHCYTNINGIVSPWDNVTMSHGKMSINQGVPFSLCHHGIPDVRRRMKSTYLVFVYQGMILSMKSYLWCMWGHVFIHMLIYILIDILIYNHLHTYVHWHFHIHMHTYARMHPVNFRHSTLHIACHCTRLHIIISGCTSFFTTLHYMTYICTWECSFDTRHIHIRNIIQIFYTYITYAYVFTCMNILLSFLANIPKYILTHAQLFQCW